MHIMTLEEFQAATEGGRIFTVEFVKRTNNELRSMNCRRHVYKEDFVNGSGRAYKPEEKALLPVWDMQTPAGKNGYRMVSLDSLVALKFGGKVYKWEDNAFRAPM